MSAGRSRHVLGFTMIELTLVGIIISILIAIALPNFFEATIRARVTAAVSDMALTAQALETYYVDFRSYPPNAVEKLPTGGLAGDGQPEVRGAGLIALTTPVSYLSAVLRDQFPRPDSQWFDYINFVDQTGGLLSNASFRAVGTSAYLLAGLGPDREPDVVAADVPAHGIEYSPSNGTKSQGDLILLGP